jgi:serine/threonine-protein kinase HipA
MPRTSHHGPLDVYMNSRLVGQLRREPSGAISFQYHPAWLKWEFSMPISLSLPPREQPYVGAPVLAVFDNLLPDNNAIRRRVAERAHAEGTDAYSLLGAIGHDCVGALQFLPEGTLPAPAGAVDAIPIKEQDIAGILNNLGTAPL